MSVRSKRPSPAMVVACIALLVALGGTSYAAVVNVPKGSVGTPQLKRNAVTAAKISPNAIRTGHVLNGSLLVEDFKAGQIPQGPKGDKGDTGAPGVSGYQRVTATSASTSTTGRSVTVSCPGGKKLLGGGAAVSPLGGGGQLGPVLQLSYPSNDTTWSAYAIEHEPFTPNWVVSAYAICGAVS